MSTLQTLFWNSWFCAKVSKRPNQLKKNLVKIQYQCKTRIVGATKCFKKLLTTNFIKFVCHLHIFCSKQTNTEFYANSGNMDFFLCKECEKKRNFATELKIQNFTDWLTAFPWFMKFSIITFQDKHLPIQK